MQGVRTFLNKSSLRLRADWNLLRRKLWAPIDKLRSIASPPVDRFSERSHPLLFLEGPEDLYHWELQTDFSNGGNSTLSLTYSAATPPHMTFSGQLRFHKELEYTGELFAEATLRRLPRRKYRAFNGLRMEVKSDGSPFRIYLAQYHYFQTELHFVNIVDKSREWTVLEIPLSCFRNAIFPPDDHNHMLSDPDMTHSLLGVRLGTRRPREKDGPFKLEVRSIELVYREDLESLGARYRYPVMVKKMEDYKKTSFVDTGSSLIDIGAYHNKHSFD
jgi:hypothetical protein